MSVDLLYRDNDKAQGAIITSEKTGLNGVGVSNITHPNVGRFYHTGTTLWGVNGVWIKLDLGASYKIDRIYIVFSPLGNPGIASGAVSAVVYASDTDEGDDISSWASEQPCNFAINNPWVSVCNYSELYTVSERTKRFWFIKFVNLPNPHALYIGRIALGVPVYLTNEINESLQITPSQTTHKEITYFGSKVGMAGTKYYRYGAKINNMLTSDRDKVLSSFVRCRNHDPLFFKFGANDGAFDSRQYLYARYIMNPLEFKNPRKRPGLWNTNVAMQTYGYGYHWRHLWQST